MFGDTAEIFSINDSRIFKGEKCGDRVRSKVVWSRIFEVTKFFAKGYYVNTVGLDEAKVRKYIQEQEESESIEDKYDSDLSNPF